MRCCDGSQVVAEAQRRAAAAEEAAAREIDAQCATGKLVLAQLGARGHAFLQESCLSLMIGITC